MKHQTPTGLKFKKLQRRLQLKTYECAGLLEMVWIVTQREAPRGDLGRLSNEELAIEIDWPGDPDALVEALTATGWLDPCPTHRLVVHGWAEHAPRYVHGIVAKRGGFVQSATVVGDCSGGLQSPTNGADDADCTEQQPNLTQPNLTNTTPSALFPDDADEPPSPGTGMRFPVVRTPSDRRTVYDLPQSVLDRYETLFGGSIDVRACLTQALAWIESNPQRRKTYSGMQSFLTRWLTRRVNQGPPGQEARTSKRHVLITPP